MAAILLTLPSPAQSVARGASGTATAEALFDQARSLLQSGAIAQACALLEASQNVEAAVGTQLLLAHCYEQLGRSASAWGLFRAVSSLSLDDPKRQQIAKIRADALEARLAKLVLRLPDGDASQRIHLTIQCDDVVMPLSTLGVAVPIDPGVHNLQLSGPAIETWRGSVEVPPGPSTLTYTFLPLVPKAPVPRPEAATAVSRAVTKVIRPAATTLPPTATAPSVWPWILASAGGVGLAAGAALSLSAQADYDNSDAHCRTARLCDPQGLTLRDSAQTQAAWATAAFALGGVSLAGAGAWWILGNGTPRPERSVRLSIEKSATATAIRMAGTF